MAKYAFKVELGDHIEVVTLENLENAKLQAIDKFTIEIGNYYELRNILAEKLSVREEEITHICIVDINKKIADDNKFSVVIDNEYLKELLFYKPDGMEIIECSFYREMKKYLFENLNPDMYEYFLTKIYNYSNSFKSLLSQYANTNANMNNTQDPEALDNIRHLEDEISKRLASYKTYRGLCICRKKSEKSIYYSTRRAKNVRVTEQALNPIGVSMNRDTEYKFKSIETRTAEYNDEYEEFLSAEEYSVAYDIDSEKKPKKY